MNLSLLPIRTGVEHLSQIPLIFDGLRWLLEGGHLAHRRLLAQHFRSTALRVLDCGCGTGIFARAFSPQAYVGIDICPRYIAHAQSRHPNHHFYPMDAKRLTFAAESFDAVIVSGVIHHLSNSDVRGVLREISRVLKPEGLLLIWEDVPTRHPLNWIGHVVHALDVGCHIRSSKDYAALLSEMFCVADAFPMRSGFMDYSVFRCRKLSGISTTATTLVTDTPVTLPSYPRGPMGSAEGCLS